MLLGAAPVHAADLGGDCCSDLEERVAELEATTARKGNRKVSLTVSGFVNEQVQWWDDGAESNVYVGTNGADPTRFRFVGKAKIDKDWSAGYIIEIGIQSARQDSTSQNNDDDVNALNLRHSAWFLESKTYGKLTVGQTSAVNDGITELSPAKTTVSKQITIFTPNAKYALRDSSGATIGTTWGDLQRGGGGEGDRFNVVRYDSPEFGGFVASANWGEDDLWAVALRYTGELHGFKIAGGISYAEVTDNSQGFNGNAEVGHDEGTSWGGSISALHIDSGLFVSFAYGEAELASSLVTGDNDYKNWNIQAGIQKKFTPLGATTIYGEYFNGDFGVANAGPVTSSDVDVWGATAIQSIDAAALDLYIAYRHYEADAYAGPAKLSLEDFDTVFAGSKISF